MSEVCEVCGRSKVGCDQDVMANGQLGEAKHWRLGYERLTARLEEADRASFMRDASNEAIRLVENRAEAAEAREKRLRIGLEQVANWAERHEGKADADIALGYLKCEIHAMLRAALREDPGQESPG